MLVLQSRSDNPCSSGTTVFATEGFGLYHPVPQEFCFRHLVNPVTEFYFEEYGPFHNVLDCGSFRYHLVVEFNNDQEECPENTGLRMIYRGRKEENRDLVREGVKACMVHFWAFLEKDYKNRMSNEGGSNNLDPYDRTVVRVQIRTTDGSFVVSEHDWEVEERLLEPVENTFPDLPKFTEAQMQSAEHIRRHIFKVKIEETYFCLKRVASYKDEDALMSELKALDKVRKNNSHPNIIHLVGILDDGNGRIGGVLLPYVPKTLEKVTALSSEDKEKWKSEISDALRFLHNLNILWRDPCDVNVLIDEVQNKPVLIDFEHHCEDLTPSEFENGRDKEWVSVNKLIFEEIDKKDLK